MRNTAARSLEPRMWAPIALGALCLLCFFAGLGSVGLFDFNEGLYVSAAREMMIRGDYVTARVNGVFFFDKPPLALWLDVLSFRLFGVNEFAARLPVALAATALVFLVYWFGTRYLSRRAGFLAACMLALNPLFFGTARQMTMDIHQSLWIAVALACFFRAYNATDRGGKRWYYGLWAACGLAFMAKGAPGVLPIIVALIFVIVDNRFQWKPVLRRVWESRLLPGIPLMLGVVAPWLYLAARNNGPSFWNEFFWHHHVQILNGKDYGHVQPVWYYVPALLAGFFPWSVFLPWSLGRQNKTDGTDERTRARRFILVWAVMVFVLFTGMTSKLVSYLLPMYGAAALLVGDWMARTLEDERPRGWKAGFTAIAVVMAAAAIGVWKALAKIDASPKAADFHRAVPEAVVAFGVHGILLVAVGTAVAAALVWTGRRKHALGTLLGTITAFILLSVVEGLPAAQATMNAPVQDLAREAGAKLADGTPLAIYIGSPRRPSVFFYLPAAPFRSPTKADNTEILIECGEKEPVDAFLANTRPAYVLTDQKRAEGLLGTTSGLQIAHGRAGWVLLYAGRTDFQQTGRRQELAPTWVPSR